MWRQCVFCWCLFRAQDQTAIQLSEMEEEMDHRIHTAERNTRLQVKTEDFLNYYLLLSIIYLINLFAN